MQQTDRKPARRSLSARVTACSIAIDILKGRTEVKRIKPEEREILVESLRQSIEVMTMVEAGEKPQ